MPNSRTWTDAQAIPTVNLASPKKADENETLTLPADVEAFYTAPIHSRVDGYVRMWYHDIGAHVKTGELLARIDTPDLDQRLEQAKGELGKAQADYNLAVLTADRWKALRASQAVSQQTSDEKAGDASARKAEVSAAQANLDRVKAMLNFRDIVAPFDGTITQRNIDVGALVSSTNTTNKPLFEVAATKEMRVYVRVPQAYTAHMKKGMPVSFEIAAIHRQVLHRLARDDVGRDLADGARADGRGDLPEPGRTSDAWRLCASQVRAAARSRQAGGALQRHDLPQ